MFSEREVSRLERKQFTFYRSYYEAIKALPKKDQTAVLLAICAYALDNEEPKLTGTATAIFTLVRPTLDSSRKRAENGKRGGEVKPSESKSEAKPKQNAREKEKEKENEIENELEDDSLLREGFERFWNLYPLKIGKEQTWQVYQEIRPDAGKLCAAVKQWERSSQWNREQGRFVPKPEKFLEEGQFDHLPGDVVPMGASGVLGEAEIQAIRRILES